MNNKIKRFTIIHKKCIQLFSIIQKRTDNIRQNKCAVDGSSSTPKSILGFNISAIFLSPIIKSIVQQSGEQFAKYT